MDSSIYGALVRLSQKWVMRYPLIDFHGSNGNRDGDGPAAYRYTEARLAKIAEDGMLAGIKKDNVDFIPNYSESMNEPVTLPSIFPNLLCNPNTGIGVALACSWASHNLCEVANAIYDYMDGKEPMLPGPDFPTGGLIINGDDIPNIIKTGRGSVKIRGKYNIEDNNIVFYELPYGVATEALMDEIGVACDEGKVSGVKNIRNESNRKGFRLVIECNKDASIKQTINQLFKETKLQTTFSYNQVALVNKTPKELGLKDCIQIYIDHNSECIRRETEFDKAKAELKLEITEGLLKAMEDIDNIIALIKQSKSSSDAQIELTKKYKFSEIQAKAIVDMKLGRLAGLEKIEIQEDKKSLESQIANFNLILSDIQTELRKRLQALVEKYGDERRTEITQIAVSTKEEKEIVNVIPEKCVVVTTEAGNIKRIPATSFRTQRRNGKGVKTQDDITSATIRTNTIDSLMIFSDKGRMYRLLVDDIPVGTNVSKGVPIKALITMESDEQPTIIYSIYRDTQEKYVLFVTKQGVAKKTLLEEYLKTKKKTGISALNLREGDSLASVSLIGEEELLLISKQGYIIRCNSKEISPSGRSSIGLKGMNLSVDDEVVCALPIRDKQDDLAIFTSLGTGKRIPLTEIPLQKRGTKGRKCIKDCEIITATLVNNNDNVLIIGNNSSICISGEEIPSMSRSANGNSIIKNNKIISVSKI